MCSVYYFIANLIICEEIFAVLSPVTNILQGVQIDLGAASLIISNVIEKLESLRQDDIFHSLLKSIEERCSTFNRVYQWLQRKGNVLEEDSMMNWV